jgi:hypothetical protein
MVVGESPPFAASAVVVAVVPARASHSEVRKDVPKRRIFVFIEILA